MSALPRSSSSHGKPWERGRLARNQPGAGGTPALPRRLRPRKRTLISFLIPAALACVSGSPALAAETLCATVAEITAAAKTAHAGDVVLLRDGTWTDADIAFEGRGTAARPITLRAATPGKVLLTGRSRVRIAGEHVVIDGLRFERCTGGAQWDPFDFRTSSSQTTGQATHCRLTNCAFVDCSPPAKETNTRYISLHGTDNRVDHCFLSGKTNLGPCLVVWLVNGQPARHQIDHNHFGPRPVLGFNGGETIRVGDSTTSQTNARCLVESNLFTGCDGEVEIISNKSCETTYRNNTFRACAGTLTLRHGHRNVVDGNFFFGEGKPMTGGVRIINRDQTVTNNTFVDLAGEGTHAALCLMNGIPDSPAAGYDQVQRARIAHNTAVNCRQSIVIGYRSPTRAEPTLPPENCTFADNLVVSRSGPIVRTMTPPSVIHWEGNVFFGAPSGLGDVAGVVALDPKLSRGPDGVWRGRANDPATRGAGCAPDLPFAPLTSADTGPAWMK